MSERSSATDDAQLLAATVRGDRDAFAVFYRRHLPAVLAFLLRLSGDRELAADTAAEVFAAALIAAERYRPEHPTALPWLCGIARHKLSEARRRGRGEDRARRALGMPREALEDSDLQRVEELADQDQALSVLLDRLPVEQRDALLARIVNERDYRHIASSQGVSEGTTRKRVSRALARLRMQTRWEQT